MSNSLSIINASSASPGAPANLPISAEITIPVLPGTDLWRKPPSTNSTNAPAYVQYRPITAFKRASVTVDGAWTRLYDQGGLVFYINSSGLESENYSSWLKTGIEMFDGVPNVGTVATPSGGYSDWSLVPLIGGSTRATIEVTPQAEKPALYVHLVQGSTKTLIREVTWVFQEKHVGLLGVGVYAARPTKVAGEEDLNGEELTVRFLDLKIEWAE